MLLSRASESDVILCGRKAAILVCCALNAGFGVNPGY